jgi:hypothetical protein
MANEKRPRPRAPDANQTAFRVMQEATAEHSTDAAGKGAVKNPAAVALGRMGGKKGGKALAEKMTPEERSESARRAAMARWKKNA